MNKINIENNKEYKDIFKISFSYGILQVYQIVINLIKSKFIALMLGPAGVGLNNLFQSGTGLISILANNGLTTSAVKDLAGLNREDNRNEEGLKISAFKKLLLITGILGSILCFIFSPFLSRYSFESDKYIFSFQILSISIFINQIAAGYGIFLRARRLTKKIITSSIVSSTFSLILALPLFYYFKLEAVVPSIIATSLINLFVLYYFTKDQYYLKVKLSYNKAFEVGKSMMKSGFFISLSSLFTSLISYIFISYLSRNSSTKIVGLYSAGFAILNTYVGLIFNAMAQDFYPRLTEKINNKRTADSLICNQIEISILLISPLLVGIVFYNKLLIELLFTPEFLEMSTMIIFASIGIYCKVFSWVASFYFMASGKFKIYLYLELFVLFLSLIFNMLFFRMYGLTGLGISSSITILISALVYIPIAKIKFNRHTSTLLLINFLFIGVSLLYVVVLNNISILITVITKALFLVLVCIFNINILAKRINFNLFEFYRKLINKSNV